MSVRQRRILAAFAGTVIAIGAFAIGRDARQDINDVTSANRALGLDVKSLSCGMADLIAHVPAVQFRGEPLQNFIGWIEARRDILASAEDCDPKVIIQLERRVRIDDELLSTLKP